MKRSNQTEVHRIEKFNNNMAKGRRKCTVGPHTIYTRNVSLLKSDKNINLLIKKSGNTNDFKIQSNQSPIMIKSNSPNDLISSVCITSFFTQNTNFKNVGGTKEAELVTVKNHYFFDNEQTNSISIQNEIASNIGEFKTDETPVAVPIHGPSTPHRINMPNSQLEDINERKIINDRKNVSPKLSPRQVLIRKPGRRKLNHGHTNSHRPVQSVSTESTNHKLTDYFPVRRSVRKCKKTVMEEKQRDMENKVLQQSEDGLEIKYFVGKGRGVVTTRHFVKGEFVVEYVGELIDQTTAKKREKIYALDQNTGCYMYYFQHRNHQYCVDATAETNKLGRLVNHSRNGNLIARIVEVESVPHLVLTAKEDIPVGVEITYDYGDRSREAIRHHPWLAL